MKLATSPRQQLKIFDKRLREVTKENPSVRPFLCEGSPLECRILLVGINPSQSAPFWLTWDALRGCDKQEWLKEYRRVNKRDSPTRRRIEILFKALSPGCCLETNVYTKMT